MDKKQRAANWRKRGWSYRRIAAKIGVSDTTIMYWLHKQHRVRQSQYYHQWTATVPGRCRLALINSRKKAKLHGGKPCLDPPEILAARFTGKCNICGRGEKGLKQRLHADHDHATGNFRGWLCFSCNSLLGRLEGQFDSVMEYLNHDN